MFIHGGDFSNTYFQSVGWEVSFIIKMINILDFVSSCH